MSKILAWISAFLKGIVEFFKDPIKTNPPVVTVVEEPVVILPEMPQHPEAQPLPAKPLEGPLKADFDVALKYVRPNEGGYSDHPNDKGGPTNKGVTQKRLSQYLGRLATVAEVKAITTELSAKIFKKYYWDVMNLDLVIDQEIATTMFDFGILCGTGKSAEWTQEILGVLVDRAIGPVTLAELNKMPDTIFIPKFAAKAKDYFKEIVAKDPSQKVFLNGWNDRADRLLTLPNDNKHKDQTPKTKEPGDVGEGLVAIAATAGLNTTYVHEMIDKHKEFRPGSNPRYWALFEIGLHSKNRRLHIFDRIEKTVVSLYAVHGTGSDPDNNGTCDKVSNIPESHMSCEGFAVTSGTYNMAKHGRALRLIGLESTNSNMLSRGIVFHGCAYADAVYVKANGRCGRSWGCPAVDENIVQGFIDKLKGGSPFYTVYKKAQ